MVSNKKARLTLQQPSAWDEYRPINKRLDNKVVVTLVPGYYAKYTMSDLYCKSSSTKFF